MTKIKSPVLRFGKARHETIGEVADRFLSTKARKEVLKLLTKVGAANLKDIAAWADQIKPTIANKPSDAETKNFLSKFSNTGEWHFVDLPVDATGYDVIKYAAFTREDDIVQTCIECINILTGKSTKFSKINALRWLVHLVGDMHQPLHLAGSYIDGSKTKPRLVLKKDDIINGNLLQKSDRGGNKINLPIGKTGKALHSYWDTDLPKMDNVFTGATYNPPPAVAVAKLVDLPAQWAGENVQFAKEVYKGLTVKGKNLLHKTYVDVTWNKTAYDKRCKPLIKTLSLSAASRLAFLLNTIYG